MLAQYHSLRRFLMLVVRLVCVLFLLVACTGQPQQVVSPSTGPTTSDDHTASSSLAEVSFAVTLPQALPSGQKMYLEILDEVTGLGLNPTRVTMESSSATHYSAKVKFPLGTAVKYRYIRSDETAPIEYTTRGQQVRYRMFLVEGPGTAQDVISAWRNTPSTANLGRIQGQVSTIGSNAPVVNALVMAGGLQTLTASDGTFLLEGLPPGTHNMVVYSLDGAYEVFQQEAVVAPNSTTPAFIQINTAKTVNVTFIVKPPDGNLKGVPVRLVGNTYSLGNTFADLRGGVNVTASRAPLMQVQDDGSYMLTLKLPVGLDLRYKYTLGDGFWNAEHASDGSFRVRQLIVPNKDTVYNDTIATWIVNGIQPVTFTVTVPADTPINDVISIQFNPYGWTEPLPMWPGGSNHWFYILYNPLHLLKNASYRYCRSEQCGYADAAETAGVNAKGNPFNATGDQKSFNDTVSSWTYLGSTGDPVTVSAADIKARSGFMAGVEFVPAYHPSWQPYVTWAFKNLKDIGANTVILTPTWHWTYQTPPVIEPVTGTDPLWADMSALNNQARNSGLEVIVHPVSLISGNANDWWSSAPRDEGWWQSWFDRYHTFIIYHADMAAQMGAKALIIGDDTILPALPNGALSDGTFSGVPPITAKRWQNLIADVRARFSGELLWMVPVTSTKDTTVQVPEFASSVDQLYVRVSAPLVESSQADASELNAAFLKLLDETVLPMQEATNQPVVLSLLYASAPGSAAGCVEDAGQTCLSPLAIQQAGLEVPGGAPDYRQQAEIYSAALENINLRSWISGFVSAGYYPPTGLRDASASIRNKPAADVLWYWFPRLTGAAQ